MDWCVAANDIFLRVDPGEHLIASLKELSEALDLTTAVITSGVGMLTSVELGFFDTGRDDYQTTRLQGIYDLSSIVGNITRRDGTPVPHVHVVFNDTSHMTYSGHLIEAECHITMEVFLSIYPLALRRIKHSGTPATRIIWESE